MVLTYEIIESIVEYVISNPDKSFDDYVSFAVSNFSFTEEQAQFWLNLFLQAICNSLGLEMSTENAKNWLINQASSGVSLDQLCDKLIAMVAVIWQQDEEIIVTRNGQLYRRIQKYNVDLTQPPSGVHTIHFANINVNVVNGVREAIVMINHWSFSLPWDKLPDRFKQLYVLWLRLQNIPVPQDLQQYVVNNIDVANLYFDINLDEAKLLGGV